MLIYLFTLYVPHVDELCGPWRHDFWNRLRDASRSVGSPPSPRTEACPDHPHQLEQPGQPTDDSSHRTTHQGALYQSCDTDHPYFLPIYSMTSPLTTTKTRCWRPRLPRRCRWTGHWWFPDMFLLLTATSISNIPLDWTWMISWQVPVADGHLDHYHHISSGFAMAPRPIRSS